MILFIKKYKYIGYFFAAIFIIHAVWLVAGWRNEAKRVPELELSIDSLEKQLIAQRDQFEVAKEITEKGNQNYEDLISQRDADIKRLSKRPTSCVPVYIAKPSNGSNAANGTGKPDQANGITDTALFNFSDECETDRIKVIILQGYIKDLMKLTGND